MTERCGGGKGAQLWHPGSTKKREEPGARIWFSMPHPPLTRPCFIGTHLATDVMNG